MNTDKPNILVIDDSISVLKKIEYLLEGFHVNIILSTCAKDALHILLNDNVSIIVCDVNMPDLSGFEFAKTVRKDDKLKNIPLIFISGAYTDHISRNLGLELGALDYILKDRLEDTLPKKIRNLLELIRFQTKLSCEVNDIDILLKKECIEHCDFLKDSISSSVIKSQMLIHLSDEIRSPLNAIIQLTELLKLNNNKSNSESGDKIFKLIKKSVTHINQLLEINTLTLKAISGDIICDYSYQNLMKFFSEIIDEITLSYPAINIGVNFRNLNAIDYLIDFYHLRIVFENLLINAIKYSKETLEVKVSIEILNSDLIVIIQDFGIGIPEQHYTNLYEPFKRGENVKHIAGSGLGLAIVKNIVNALNGEICFSSTLNVGSVFKVTIPIRSRSVLND